MEKSEKFFGGRVSFALFLCLFFAIGVVNTAGLFLSDIVNDLAKPYSAVSLMVTCMTGACFVASLFVGNLAKRIGPKAVISIGCVLLPINFLLYAAAHNLAVLYIGAIIGGFGVCFLQVCSSIITTNWYIEKRDSRIGFVMSGVAFGAVLMSPLAGVFIRVLNWRMAYVILALIVAVVCIPLSLILVKGSPDKVGQHPLGYEESQQSKQVEQVEENAALADEDVPGIPASEARRTGSHWIMFVGIVLVGFMMTGFQSYLPTLWTSKGMDPTVSSIYLAIFAALGGLGGILGGYLVQKFKVRIFMLYTVIAFAVSMLICVLCGIGVGWVIVSLICAGLAYPMNTILPSYTTMDAFGRKDYDKLLGLFMGGITLGGAIITPIMGGIFDATGSVGMAFMILGIAAVIGVILIYIGLAMSPMKKMERQSA